MEKKKHDELINLLNDFSKELICNMDCGNCDYGILISYGCNYSCPLDIVEDMVRNN